MKKIVTVLGARPQFIKASVVSHALREHSAVQELVVHTGQHFDANMSDVFFAELGMQAPAFHLDIHGGGHGAMTGRMLMEIERVLHEVKPDAVLVYGDTNSTLAGALAAVKLHIPIAHVEAGLRSFNMRMPEEVNRILTDRISHWLFAPTEVAMGHLKSEGVAPERCTLVGDVMLDVALHHGAKLTAEGGAMHRLGLSTRRFILATVHRAENTDDMQRLQAIIQALVTISRDTPVVWPVHPRTRALLNHLGILDSLPATLKICEPLGYLDMVQLEKHAALIATDSGGVQKEAFFYRVPCVTFRDETEWTELVDAGWNRLAPPTGSEALVAAMREAMGSEGKDVEPYGGGDAAVQIAATLVA